MFLLFSCRKRRENTRGIGYGDQGKSVEETVARIRSRERKDWIVSYGKGKRAVSILRENGYSVDELVKKQTMDKKRGREVDGEKRREKKREIRSISRAQRNASRGDR